MAYKDFRPHSRKPNNLSKSIIGCAAKKFKTSGIPITLLLFSLGSIFSGNFPIKQLQTPEHTSSAFATGLSAAACDPSLIKALPVESSTASGYFGNFIPSNAFDSQFHTLWITSQRGGWITADLGSLKHVCSVQITWFVGKSLKYSFSIALSNSSDSGFEKVYSGTSSGSSTAGENYNVNQTDGRYVKVTVNGNNKNTWSVIREINFKGSEPLSNYSSPTDNVPPTIIPPANIVVNSTGILTQVGLGTPTVSDNMDPSPVVTNNAPVTGFPIGKTVVVWTVTDSSGNYSNATQTVTILNSTATNNHFLKMALLRSSTINYYSGILKPTDACSPVDFQPSKLPANCMITMHPPTLGSLESAVDGGGLSIVMLDEENNVSAGWLSDVATGYAYAHSKDMMFGVDPQKSQLDSYASELGHYCDYMALQIPPTISDYAAKVHGYVNSLKDTNPGCKVVVQLNMNVNGSTTQNVSDIVPLINAFNSVKGFVDGIQLYYVSDGTEVSKIEEFYNATGLR